MMKKMQKLIALIMTLTLVFGVLSIGVSAKATADSSSQEEYVAELYVCQMPRMNYMSGHTWVYFRNLTKHSIKVGLYTVPKGQGVSIGTFGYSIADGKGLYYNAEAYRYNAAKTTDFINLKKNLTQEQLDAASAKILVVGNWSYLLNCSYSAFEIWNVTSEKPIQYMIFPLFARLSILMYPQHQKSLQMYIPKLNQVYKQIGSGADAYIVPGDPSVPPDYGN